MTHDDVFELLGAYALDAVDPNEVDAIEAHLRTCDICTDELRELSEGASSLASSAALQSPALHERISLQLQGAPVADIAKRRRVPARMLAIVAAAAVFIGAIGIVSTIDFSEDPPATIAQSAQKLRSSPESASLELQSSDGLLHAQMVMDTQGVGYLYDQNLPSISADRTYQLWAMVDGKPISIGLFSSSSDGTNFTSPTGAHVFAVTNEVANGVTAPTQQPIVLGSIGT